MFDFKFSIIIVAHNNQQYIKRAIDSIISQSIGFKDNVEIIIVNDGSSDKTSEIIDECIENHPDNIKLITNKEKLGISASRNLAINQVKGEFISFLGADDYISKKTLESVFKTFNANLNLDVVAIPVYLLKNQKRNHILNYKFKELSDIHINNQNNVILSDNEYNLNIYDEELDDVLASPDKFNLHLFKDENSGDFNTLSLNDEVILLDETYNLKLYEEDNDELILAGSGVNTVDNVSMVNLNEYPQAIQVSASSAFFRAKSVEDIRFDESIDSIDAVFINEILLKKPILALISNVSYYMENDYIGYLNSSKDYFALRFKNSPSSNEFKKYFNLRFKNFYFKLIEESINYYGHVLEFIQYNIAFDLQWLFDINFLDFILNNVEFKELYFNLIEVLSYVSDDIILNQKNINQSLKAHILLLKHFKYDYLFTKNFKFNDSLLNDEFINNLASSRFKLSYKQMNLFKRLVKEDPLHIDIYKIEDNEIYISGFYSSFFDLDLDIVLDIENTFESIYCDELKYPQRDYYSLNCPYGYNHYFEVKIPIDNYDFDEENLVISFRAVINESVILDDYDGYINENSFDLPIDFSKSCKLSNISKYQLSNEYLSTIDNNSIIISKKSKSELFKLESKILLKLFNNKDEGWRGGLNLRFLYTIFKNLKSKPIWIFMDKVGSCNGNAFTLYKYADSINDGIKKYYIVDKDNEDFDKIKKVANVLEKNSNKHKLITLFADKIISSHLDKSSIYPFWENFDYFAGLINSKFIFIQDNVIVDNLSNEIYRANNDLNLLVSISDSEKDSFLDENNHYNYTEDIVKVLGFPRFDNLEDKSKDLDIKEIVIMPSSIDVVNMTKKEFIESNYFKTFNELLNNPELMGFVKSKSYKIIFKLQSDVYKFIDEFKKHEAVEFDCDSKYEDIVNNGSLLITDYSPIAFDFAYLKKPVIYYHFDKCDEIENKFSFSFNSYFDYEEMGFGEVVDSQKELIDLIKDYIFRNCNTKASYRLRVNDFFKYRDKDNSKRVYEAIKEL